jgi:hypothetical protein
MRTAMLRIRLSLRMLRLPGAAACHRVFVARDLRLLLRVCDCVKRGRTAIVTCVPVGSEIAPALRVWALTAAARRRSGIPVKMLRCPDSDYA